MAIVDTADGKSGIGYVGDIDTWSRYEVWVNGRRVLEISVDNDDPELKMYVGQPGARQAAISGDVLQQAMVGLPLETNGRAVKGPHEVGGTPDSPGELKDHIDGMSVQQYVVMRLPFLLIDVYVPKEIAE